MKRYTGKTMLAMVFGWDNSDMAECQYKSGRTDRPVFVINEDYYCAVKIGQKPAKNYEGIEWDWEKVKSSFAESNGWQVWKAKG
ncbi:hypothetical protein JR311_19665 (plasmid) [Bacillus velezensis]|uniref:hypothetical protein n=1 Tax=Bacillus subtilis group TaxID=653685 RepID=UPI0007505162|nr:MULTISPECIES: hypothetical protein [Bacillus subtilis group]MCY9056114.1 hypothetical protein [Bacillus spizizenii]KUP30285.1 hypothetical protein AU385_17890 [Bacillus halotolerans]MCY7757850.1 hypothetical protein [Bacillus inaquosorum]MCY8731490.1 hypothetical protein [Bacillus inaquosorum]MCY9099504.1 hypothetical protein [Bacillus inaquosorum]